MSNNINNFMSRAIELSIASVRSNGGPFGCVIVKNDEVISFGQTGVNGRPHAEYNAIKSCKENLKGSKIYVTLEPCAHYGKTSPCTNIIIRSKIDFSKKDYCT